MKIDAIKSKALIGVLEELNRLKVPRENVVNVFNDCQNGESYYIAVFYI